MRKLLGAVFGMGLGYGVGVVAGAVLVSLLSSNTHDKSVEMAMTAAFVTGPIGAVAGLLAAFVLSRRGKPVNAP